MAMLKIEKRKEYMEHLGFTYDKAGIKKLQKKFFKRKSDIDGIYGKNTDILLYNAYWFSVICTHFKLEEFICPMYCTGYPCRVNKKLLYAMEKIRKHCKVSVIVTCGARCGKYNNSLTGSVQNSAHLYFKAADHYAKGHTDTTANRKKYIKWLKKNIDGFKYAYGNGYSSYGTKVYAPNMGNAVHIEVA